MPKPPHTKCILEIDQLFGELVQLPVLTWRSIDRQPRPLDRCVGCVGLANVAFVNVRIDREAAAREQADRLIVERRRIERALQRRMNRRLFVRFQHCRSLVAEHELDLAVLP